MNSSFQYFSINLRFFLIHKPQIIYYYIPCTVKTLYYFQLWRAYSKNRISSENGILRILKCLKACIHNNWCKRLKCEVVFGDFVFLSFVLIQNIWKYYCAVYHFTSQSLVRFSYDYGSGQASSCRRNQISAS